jgi:hypothetical protein
MKADFPMKHLVMIGAVLVLVGSGSRSLVRAEEAPADQASDPVQYVIEDIQGSNVQVMEDGTKVWDKAEEGQVLEKGDEIKVGDGSEATLALRSETTIQLAAGTDLQVQEIKSNESQGFLSRLTLLAGSVLADVKKHLNESSSSFEIESNGVVCGVRGTAFEMNTNGEEAQVSTHEGQVEVAGGGESHPVSAGQISSFRKGRFLALRALREGERSRFQKWRQFRQSVWKKRTIRIMQIKNHQRKVWKRRHAARKLRREWRRHHN